MAAMKYLGILFIAILVTAAEARRNQLFMIMLDGFRWDYVDMQEDLPGFRKFLNEGIRANWLNPLFPSLSLPTWTTLSTGLYPENHGIVGNYIWDSEAKDFFSLDDDDSMGQQKWWTSEPIWITATRHGLKVALNLWSQCHVSYNGVTPEFCKPYSYPTMEKPTEPKTLEKDITKAIENLEDGFDLVQVYCEQPDYAGHAFGPDGDAVKQTIKNLDNVILSMMNQLEEKGLNDQVNVLILSDHGMTDIGVDKVEHIDLDKYLNADLVEKIADNGAFFNIKVPSKNIEQVYTQLSSIPGADVFRHEDIPLELHFKDHKYIHDFIMKTKPGYWITGSRNTDKMLPPEYHTYTGTHGYHPNLEDMRGIFMAKGPDFEIDRVVDDIDVVDVYQLMAHVLQVTPLPHNGTWSHVEPAFKKAPGISVKTVDYYVAAKVLAGAMFFIIGALAYVYTRPTVKPHYE